MSNIQPSTKPVVLVIDPDPLTMTGVAAALHLAGYESHCARDREAARKAADDLSLDLVICDVMVEGACGLELCRELQKTPNNSDVPLMFVSSKQRPDVVRRTHDSSGVYFLRKPFDPDILLALVEKALWMPHLVRANVVANAAEPSIPTPHGNLARMTAGSMSEEAVGGATR